MSQVRMAQNPQAMLNQMVMSNPHLNDAITFIKNNGGDPQTAFYNYAKQLGLDPQTILNTLR